MNATDLARFIAEQKIAAELIFLAQETPTVEAAAMAVGTRPEQIGKSILFIIDRTQPLLIIANGLARIDYKKLSDFSGVGRKRIRLATQTEVLALTGYPAGTVPPFGHHTPLPTLIEANLLTLTDFYAGGGAINVLVRLTISELRRVVPAGVVTLAENR